MSEFSIAGATTADLTGTVEEITVDTKALEGATGGETSWQNAKWTQYNGYYKTIPELKAAIDTRAIWTVGKGFTANPETTAILNFISGWGNDTFNSILKNMVVCMRVSGDAFAEIIRDDDGFLLNLKPLDPGSMRTIVDSKGIIKRYEQTNKTNMPVVKFKPNEIFHLTNKRIGDEIHGVSDVEALEDIILANKESFTDMKLVMHRHVKPIMAFKLDTDDQTKIDAFIAKMDGVVNKGENIYIPKGSVEFELVAVPANATLNPLPWREHLKNYFYQVVGIPQIIMGSSGEFTESTAKIAYLSFQQSVEDDQLAIEEAIWRQLYLRVELNFPASLRNELLSDEGKDAEQGMELQPNDLIAGMGE